MYTREFLQKISSGYMHLFTFVLDLSVDKPQLDQMLDDIILLIVEKVNLTSTLLQ